MVWAQGIAGDGHDSERGGGCSIPGMVLVGTGERVRSGDRTRGGVNERPYRLAVIDSRMFRHERFFYSRALRIAAFMIRLRFVSKSGRRQISPFHNAGFAFASITVRRS